MMDRIERVFQVIGAMLVLIAGVYAVYGLLMQSDIDRVRYSDNDERYNQYRSDQASMFKKAKKYFIISVAWILFTVLIPTRNTVIGMIATSYITNENIIAAKEVATDSIDYTITKILEITNGKKNFK